MSYVCRIILNTMEKSILEIQLEKMQRYIAKGWTKKDLYRFFPKSIVNKHYSK